jgi:hypothetical protein
MTREKVVERIAELEKEIAKVVAHHTALTGQLNESKWWMRRIDGITEPENA